ncbi:hypothetical protein AGLY_003472 [Aphis glycines]|uniref:Regulatory protein zeste n=1 Tax=Aphis glycines TaxID=307491 RepID=A0A6G0TZS6_APHGL|nr:hypothetical protein AGLY_003472 [Aphis glycines]
MNTDINKIIKRTANFTASEIDVLITLVKKYKSVIKCMKTDTVNAKMKKDAWIKIQNEFNCQLPETPRTAIILKNKYENVKRNVKKQYAEEKTFSRGTGGGPTKVFQGTSITSTVGEILQTRMTGETSIYDSDTSNLQYCNAELETVTLEHQFIELVHVSNGDDNDIVTLMFSDIDPVNESTTREQYNGQSQFSATKRDWTTYFPADLKSSWASTRASLSEEQKSAFTEHHKLKMHLKQEKHNLELQMMTKKHKIEIENLKLTNDILKMQKEAEKVKYSNINI